MNFVVVGAGAWGSAFAVHLTRAGRPVVLAPRRAEQAHALATARENHDYLPGVELPPELEISADLVAALATADVVLLASPTQALRETATRVRSALPAAAGRARLVISLSKGLELKTHLR